MNIRRTVYLLVVLSSVSLFALFLQFRSSQDYSRSNRDSLRVVLGGDLYVGPRLNNYTTENEVHEFVGSVAERIADADLHFANLEAPLVNQGDTTVPKSFHLRSDPSLTVPVLNELSVDGVSLANNHMLDYGSEGLLSTLRYLNRNNIKHTGAGASLREAADPVFFERKGRTVGFLSFSNTFPEAFWADLNHPGTAYGHPDYVRAMTDYAAERADRVIVSFHWGGEGRLRPKDYQVNLARMAVDAGADVVFGHHPHTIQPMERYNDGLIVYSLGNYVFTTLSHRVNYGLLADINFERNRAPSVSFHVMNVNNYDVHYRPRVVRTLTDPLELSLYIKRPDFVRLVGQDRPWVNPLQSFARLH